MALKCTEVYKSYQIVPCSEEAMEAEAEAVEAMEVVADHPLMEAVQVEEEAWHWLKMIRCVRKCSKYN
jgi:hypothetical protein